MKTKGVRLPYTDLPDSSASTHELTTIPAADSWVGTLLISLPYLAGLLTLGLALQGNIGFPLDDSWIHQVIARNLVQHHTWGFTPGVSSSGTSSTLWTLILAVHYVLFPHLCPVFFPLLLTLPC